MTEPPDPDVENQGPATASGYEDTALRSQDDMAPLPAPKRPSVDPFLGRVLNGLYRIEEQIGSGGMGMVYRATHIHLHRSFAIKVLTRSLNDGDEGVERFKREAMAASRIDHDNIVDVVSLDTTEDGEVFIVMELLKGQSLAMRIAGGRLDLEEALHIAYQMCRALGAAHENRIVHRDLKPENVFIIDKAGMDFVKVLDFGISKMKIAEAAQVRMTKTGQLVGTPLYMSPEQARGEVDINLGADVYALGCILYEMLTGVPPFEGKNHFQLLWKHGNETPESPRKRCPGARISSPLNQVIMRALAKEPDRRFESMLALEEALLSAVPDIEAPPHILSSMPSSGRISASMRPPKRSRYKLAFLLVIGVVLGAGSVMFSRSEPMATPMTNDDHQAEREEPPPPTDEATAHTDERAAQVAAEDQHSEVYSIRFVSVPDQAEVWLGDTRLGITPFRSTVRADGTQLEVEFRRRGYTSARIAFVPVEGGLVEAGLRRTRSHNSPGRGRNPLKQEI